VSKTADELVESINANAALDGKIRASNDNGKLRIENLSTQKLDIIGASGGKITGATSARADIAGNAVRADLANQFNELRDQLDKLSDDASFNGVNLLRGDNLKITFNETGTSSIDVQSKGGKSINSANLKLETTLEAKDLDSDEAIDSFVSQIKGALNEVRSQSSALGSNLSIVENRKAFTSSMIDTLETGAGNLTLADMNQEAANMMSLQTRQSLASSTLSMANQADQGVLQLLR
jgi:flagellin-like hook-associated protein FlgL